MRDVLEDLDRLLAVEGRVALATVIHVWGSAPRRPGGKMVVAPSGAVAGSVSGGCVEGAVVEGAMAVLESGEPRLLEFGVADAEAWAVGLSCGGRIEVWVEAVIAGDPVFEALRADLCGDRLVASGTVLTGAARGRRVLLSPEGPRRGAALPADLEEGCRSAAEEAFASFGTVRRELEEQGAEVFVEAHPPRPELVLVGAVHVAVHLVTLARELGFRTVVLDPRSAFATAERFAHADELIRGWPPAALDACRLDEGTYLAVLSHDPKIDLPALEVALRRPLRYIGALGSKKTHQKRVAALAERGFSEERIARIHAPIGIDLGGRRPEEIAVSILAELVAARHGRR
ncbi:MAG: XdhC/CoxI family protein [Acidobacteriota bacterium]